MVVAKAGCGTWNAWQRHNNKHEPVDDACLEAMREQRRRRRLKERATNITKFSGKDLVARLSMWPGCWMCGEKAGVLEHVIPIARGGPHMLANLRPACGVCNGKKGVKSWRLFPPARHAPSLP